MTAKPHGVYVVSAGRPTNVPHMQALLSPDPVTWVVPHAERHDYAQLGAHTVIAVKPPDKGEHQLTKQRSTALHHAVDNGLVCIQSDDDAKGFRRKAPDGSAPAILWPELRDAMVAALDGTSHLVGLPPTSNAYFARDRVLSYGFVLASLCATDVADPDWDRTLSLKEDYDFTCAHLAKYGRITRLDGMVANYQHNTNRGGVVAYRTRAREQAAADQLIARWPQFLRAHPTRPGELSFIPRRTTP